MNPKITVFPIAIALAGTLCNGAAPAAAREHLETRSSVTGLAITNELSELPAAPATPDEDDFCGHFRITPVSAGGRIARALGWSVTGELVIGGFTLVSFAGGFEQGTSGSCLLSDGNIGVFDGEELLALAYAPASSPLTIGRIEPFGETGARIWDGDYLPQPVADLQLTDTSAIAIVPLATEEAFCDGNAIVPNIYGMQIAKARDMLAEHGWTPTGQSPDYPLDPRSADLVDMGLTEVSGCSGTGFGFCSFDYHAGGTALSVITVGDTEPPFTPAVSSYGVHCTGRG